MMSDRIEVELEAEIFMKKEGEDIYPCIQLRDKPDGTGNEWIGYCTYNSVESLARIYQKDKEYRSKDKCSYWLRWKGNKSRTQLFQKAVIHGYGEPNTYIDETDIK